VEIPIICNKPSLPSVYCPETAPNKCKGIKKLPRNCPTMKKQVKQVGKKKEKNSKRVYA